MKFSVKTLAATFALVGAAVYGCNAEDLLDQLSVQEEAQKLIDEIRAEGGEAELVLPGVSAKVMVDDENSPIYGAFLEIPDGALGDTDLDILASVKPIADFAGPSSLQTLMGPGVEVQMFHISTGDKFTPKVAVKVGVPTTAPESVEDIDIGHQASDDATEMTVPEDSTLLEQLPRVVQGSFDSLSPFAAVRRVVVPPPVLEAPEAPADCSEYVSTNSPTPQHVSTKTFSFDIDRKVTQFSYDGVDDGSEPDYFDYYEYNADGLLVSGGHDYTDSQTDSDTTFYSFRADAQSPVTQISRDNGNDGIDFYRKFMYNGSAVTAYADGIGIQQMQVVYDGNGRIDKIKKIYVATSSVQECYDFFLNTANAVTGAVYVSGTDCGGDPHVYLYEYNACDADLLVAMWTTIPAH